MLNGIELADDFDRLLRDGRGLDGLEEVAADVGEARGTSAARDIFGAVVAAVPIDEQHAVGAPQEVARQCAGAVVCKCVGDVVTTGLVRRAEVAGQMLPGTISVWILPEDSAFPGLPYVIFPGNVGEAGTLADVIERLAA